MPDGPTAYQLVEQRCRRAPSDTISPAHRLQIRDKLLAHPKAAQYAVLLRDDCCGNREAEGVR